MSLNAEYESAVKKEQIRLRIAAKWAYLNRTPAVKEYDKGRIDRLTGQPCRSSNGHYLDGWYSV